MAYPQATAPYPTGSAQPNPPYSGIFIPEIWSGNLLHKFYDATVIAAIFNTDYEGEIKAKGDTIHIRRQPDIEIFDHEENQVLEVHRPSIDKVSLQVNKGKYFNLGLGDVTAIQQDINQLSMWADNASQKMKVVIDKEILKGLVGKANASNMGATAGRIDQKINLGTTTAPVSISARASTGNTEIIDLITYLGQTLDEQNIPVEGRWLIIPPWVNTTIKRSELRDASLTGDGQSMARNGRLGMIDRFTIYESNQLPMGVSGGLAAGQTALFAGHPHGMTFASQLTEMETLRSERAFQTLLRGLQVYGWDVIDNISLSQAVVTKG